MVLICGTIVFMIKTKHISFRLPVSILSRIDAIAYEDSVSRSNLILKLLLKGLELKEKAYEELAAFRRQKEVDNG